MVCLRYLNEVLYLNQQEKLFKETFLCRVAITSFYYNLVLLTAWTVLITCYSITYHTLIGHRTHKCIVAFIFIGYKI